MCRNLRLIKNYIFSSLDAAFCLLPIPKSWLWSLSTLPNPKKSNQLTKKTILGELGSTTWFLKFLTFLQIILSEKHDYTFFKLVWNCKWVAFESNICKYSSIPTSKMAARTIQQNVSRWLRGRSRAGSSAQQNTETRTRLESPPPLARLIFSTSSCILIAKGKQKVLYFY